MNLSCRSWVMPQPWDQGSLQVWQFFGFFFPKKLVLFIQWVIFCGTGSVTRVFRAFIHVLFTQIQLQMQEWDWDTNPHPNSACPIYPWLCPIPIFSTQSSRTSTHLGLPPSFLGQTELGWCLLSSFPC